MLAAEAIVNRLDIGDSIRRFAQTLCVICRPKVMTTPSPDFSTVFDGLRAILQEHASKFVVSADRADYYCLEIPFSPKFKKPFPVAWVKVSKSYVSFHYKCLLPQGMSQL